VEGSAEWHPSLSTAAVTTLEAIGAASGRLVSATPVVATVVIVETVAEVSAPLTLELQPVNTTTSKDANPYLN
jgi:hypothetical protein